MSKCHIVGNLMPRLKYKFSRETTLPSDPALTVNVHYLSSWHLVPLLADFSLPTGVVHFSCWTSPAPQSLTVTPANGLFHLSLISAVYHLGF